MKRKGLDPGDPVYLYPRYVPSRGGATDVALADKSVITEYRTIKSVVNSMLSKACVDRKAVKNVAAEITGRKILLPLYVNVCILLVPFKMRRPLVEGDASYGYVNYHAVEGILEKRSSCIIRLVNGLTVPVLGSVATVRKIYGDASLVAKSGCFKSESGSVENTSFEYFNANGQNPAIKSEIEEMKREIWAVRETFAEATK